MISNLKNIIKSIFFNYFERRLNKIRRILDKKDYAFWFYNTKKLLLVDKKTAEIFKENVYLKLNPD